MAGGSVEYWETTRRCRVRMVKLAAGMVNQTPLAWDDNRILGFVAKRFAAGDGIHYEPRWFKPWPQGARGELEAGEGRYPIGDLFFEVGGVRIGFEICEDAWVAARPGASLALRGVDVL